MLKRTLASICTLSVEASHFCFMFPLIWSKVKSTAHQMFASTMYAHMPHLIPLYSYQVCNQDFPIPSLLDNLQWRTEKLVDKIEKSDELQLSEHVIYSHCIICGSQGMCLLVSSYYCNVASCVSLRTGLQQWIRMMQLVVYMAFTFCLQAWKSRWENILYTNFCQLAPIERTGIEHPNDIQYAVAVSIRHDITVVRI